MFCPRCGAESDEGPRYCASCGSQLPRSADSSGSEGADAGSFRSAFDRLVGINRRSRIVSAATATAVIIAIVAFIALAPAKEGASLPQDALTRSLDSSCVHQKTKIAAAQRLALTDGGFLGVSRYADAMVPIVGEWRLELGRVEVPPDRRQLVDAMRSALLEVEIEAGTLARAARESDRHELATAAVRVDAATADVEAAVASLELQRCGHLAIDQGRLIQR